MMTVGVGLSPLIVGKTLNFKKIYNWMNRPIGCILGFHCWTPSLENRGTLMCWSCDAVTLMEVKKPERFDFEF